MTQYRAYEYRMNPTESQIRLIHKTIGCVRFVFNHFLDAWNTAYQTTGKGLSSNVCSAMLPAMKKEEATQWLSEVDSIALQSSIKDLEQAFKRFFSKQNQKPKFKSKNNPVQSYTTKNGNQNIQLTNNRIKLPKLGWVKVRMSQQPKGRIVNATISRKPDGCYMVSLLCEEPVEKLPEINNPIGIDLGITDFAVFSDGSKIDNNRFTKHAAKKLKREQRKLSRRILNSKQQGVKLNEAKNVQKQKLIVAKLHAKVANQRKDFLNKLSTDVIKNHDVICIEDLNVQGMRKNRKLAKSISDVSWSSFVTKLEYKAAWYGRIVIKIGRFFPSSQLCSACHHSDGKKALAIRHWECSQCGVQHDRDINASRNILTEGLRLHALT